MELAKLIIDLIGKLIWPVVVMIIILIFRKQILIRFKDITEINAAGVKINMPKIKAEIKAEIKPEIKSRN